MRTTAPGSFFSAMAMLMTRETSEKSGVGCWADCWFGEKEERKGSEGDAAKGAEGEADSSAEPRNDKPKRQRSRVAAMVAARGLGRIALKSRPRAKVARAPMRTYQV